MCADDIELSKEKNLIILERIAMFEKPLFIIRVLNTSCDYELPLHRFNDSYLQSFLYSDTFIKRHKLFYFHNIIKFCDEMVDLSKYNIQNTDLDLIFGLLNYKQNIIELNLSLNNFTFTPHHQNAIIKMVRLLDSNFTYLSFLNLSGNRLKAVEASIVFDWLVKSQIIFLDLSSNNIQIPRSGLNRQIEKYINRVRIKPVIDLSQNYLDEDCDNSFKLTTYNVYKYSFFVSKPRQVNSRLIPNLKISVNDWIICLGCKKKHEHSVIFLEGMRENGQRFLESYDIRAEGLFSNTAYANNDRKIAAFFDSSKYLLKHFCISNIQGEEFQSLVRSKLGEAINFSVFSTSGSSNYVNCLSWSINALRQINLEVEHRFFCLPSRAAGGNSCINSTSSSC